MLYPPGKDPQCLQNFCYIQFTLQGIKAKKGPYKLSAISCLDSLSGHV